MSDRLLKYSRKSALKGVNLLDALSYYFKVKYSFPDGEFKISN